MATGAVATRERGDLSSASAVGDSSTCPAHVVPGVLGRRRSDRTSFSAARRDG